MSLAKIYSRAPQALNAPLVEIEVHLSNGLPAITLVGLPEKAVKESKDRIKAALANCGFQLPSKNIIINLAPADLPKDGSRYDFPLALGILAAAGNIGFAFQDYEFHGELSLSGELRPVKGVIPVALQAREAGRKLVVAPENLAEAQLVYPEALAVKSLTHFIAIINGQSAWLKQTETISQKIQYPDFIDVIGQHQAKRALLIAAAGGHHILMFGSPGTGKSMLAQRLPGILPPMNLQEAIESASIYSISNQGFKPEQWSTRPFRAPHHSSSSAALVGGGSIPRPGEISLAHHGVLFLDELPEFEKKNLEMLREPLENSCITISRAASKTEFPARFQLVAAMNPCPCGYYGDKQHQCTDTPEQVKKYRNKISGPLLDRIDLYINIPRLTPQQLHENQANSLSSEELRAQATSARLLQIERQGVANAHLDSNLMKKALLAAPESIALLDKASEQMHFSMRSYHKILKVARTIADLAASPKIEKIHLAEALSYRQNFN